MNETPCTVCGEGGHHVSKCPSLVAPLKDGFYSPPAGARQASDDDDESLTLLMKFYQLTLAKKKLLPSYQKTP